MHLYPFLACFIELVFPFNFSFYIIIHPRRFLSWNVTSLFGVTFENIIITVSLKTDTYLWILLSLSILLHNQYWNWVCKVKSDGGGLNERMGGQHYELVSLVGQWILRQCTTMVEAVGEWLWHKLVKPMQSCKGFELCDFSCCFIFSLPDWKSRITIA